MTDMTNPPMANHPTTTWDTKLWANIKAQTWIPDLYQHINTGKQIIISSDATMNPKCNSSFAWLIANKPATMARWLKGQSQD